MNELLASSDFLLGVAAGATAMLLLYAVLLVIGVVVKPWLSAAASGASVGIPRLIGMRLRGTPPELIIDAYVMDQKRGGHHSLDVIEAAYLAFRHEIRDSDHLLAVVNREASRMPSPDDVRLQ